MSQINLKELSEKFDIVRLSKDPAYFIKKILGIPLVPFQEEWLKYVQENRRTSLIAFRSSGKTEVLFVDYMLWQAVVNPGYMGIVVSNSEEQSKSIIKRMKNHIQQNEYLKSLMPKNQNQIWTKTEIELSNGSWVGCKPYNENLRGYHVDVVACDEGGQYRDHSVFKEVILPMVRAKKGKVFVVGTPESEIDLLHSIEQDPFFRSFKTYRYPALDGEHDYFYKRYPDADVRKEDGVICIYEKTDDGSYELIDSFDTLTWSQEYLLRPLGSEDSLFPLELIQPTLDSESDWMLEPETYWQYYMGIDFAISGSSRADYTVITVLARNMHTDKLRVAYIDRSRGLSYEDQKNKIKSIAEAYGAVKVLCDDSNVGKTFIQDLFSMGLPVEGFTFGGNVARNGSGMSQNKRELMMALREAFERKQITIPNTSKNHQLKRVVGVLIDELTSFGVKLDMRTKNVKFESTGRHDDLVDSLALAVYVGRARKKASFAVHKSGIIARRT